MSKRQTIQYNIKQIPSDDRAIIAGILSFGSILFLGLNYLDMEQMIGNMGQVIAYGQIWSHWLLAILFGLFVSATVFKIRRSNKRSPKKTGSGLFGGLLSAVIIGCPACSLGLATYIGIGTFLVQLPAFGLEIKLLGIAILVRASWSTIRDLYICPIK